MKAIHIPCDYYDNDDIIVKCVLCPYDANVSFKYERLNGNKQMINSRQMYTTVIQHMTVKLTHYNI